MKDTAGLGCPWGHHERLEPCVCVLAYKKMPSPEMAHHVDSRDDVDKQPTTNNTVSRHQTGFSQATAGNLAQTTSKDERERTRIEKVLPLTLGTSDVNWVNQATKQETEIPKTRTDVFFQNSFG